MPQEVTVTIPDGVYEGEEFMMEFEGQTLSVIVPQGCQPGDPINLEVDVPAAAEAAPSTVNVVVPDGCYEGDEFTVDFDGRQFNIVVPDGCGPGVEIAVEVPPAEPEAAKPPAQEPSSSSYRDMHIPPYRGGSSKAPASESRAKPSSDWAPASSLFAMGPAEGFGNPAGEFHVGQLVQVTRSDGSWTYGKIMEHEEMGNTYSVMTRAGPKHCECTLFPFAPLSLSPSPLPKRTASAHPVGPSPARTLVGQRGCP